METVSDYCCTFDWLVKHLKKNYNVNIDDPKSDLATYGLDSVEKIFICFELSEYLGKKIDINILLDCDTCEEFVSVALSMDARNTPIYHAITERVVNC